MFATLDGGGSSEALNRESSIRIGCWVRIKNGKFVGRRAPVIKMQGRCVTVQFNARRHDFPADDVEVLPIRRAT
jgi:hypothetical protein